MAEILLTGTLSLNTINKWLCVKLVAKHIIASSCDSGDSDQANAQADLIIWWAQLYMLSWLCYAQAYTFWLIQKRIFWRKTVINFLPINQNICLWCLKESSRWDGSFEQPQHMFKLRNMFWLKTLTKFNYTLLSGDLYSIGFIWAEKCWTWPFFQMLNGSSKVCSITCYTST